MGADDQACASDAADDPGSADDVVLDCTREEFTEHAADGPAVVRVAATLDVDVSPLAAYDALADGSHSFLLESAEKTAASDPGGAFRPDGADESDSANARRHARYSFVGYDPDAVVAVDADGTDVQTLRAEQTAAASLGGAAGGAADGDTDSAGSGADVLDRLREVLPDAPRRGFPDGNRQLLDGGLVGFLAYDAVYDLWLDEVGVERPETPLPDAEFVVTTRTLVFDRETGDISLVCTPVVRPGDDPDAVYNRLRAEATRVRDVLAEAGDPSLGGVSITAERAGSRSEYEDAVERAKEAVLDGEVYQAVVSRTRELDGDVDPRALYASLRETNPSPYMFLLSHGDRTIVGASPETLVAVHDDTVVNNPIAGTCPRGSSPVEDRRLAGEMLADEKERAEHAMLVDLARNDVRRVSEPGSVRVPEFMRVLKYSHVQHIESTVTGTLAGDADVAGPRSGAGESGSPDAFDAVRASFPAGTLSGAPKVRAMEHVHDLESDSRGIYGGGVGYVSWTGDAEFAIAIRSATVEHDSADDGTDTVRVRAGAGVVADSDPAAEYEETESKMRGVLDAIERVREESDADSDDCAPAEPGPQR
ncbi:anthranilate synthase component I [Halobacterium zhouii]|uniref:anthranilate synthase component I n=1 Tax=Halobacterium zhouii TaxID=2902624 RepID=UPI001E2BBB6B|nr:anthranilate synthase component I [Halobacterium zhouii]